MVLCLVLAAISFAGAAEQPNIVIFLADDHGRASSVYGSFEVRTPMRTLWRKMGWFSTMPLSHRPPAARADRPCLVA
jgi:hypothetical protein